MGIEHDSRVLANLKDKFPGQHTCRYVLEKALDLTSGERAKQHGDKRANHANIAGLWSSYLGVPINPGQVAVMMVLLKAARTKSGGFNPDDFIDMAGYAGVAIECFADPAG
jgi:hypothetical protein